MPMHTAGGLSGLVLIVTDDESWIAIRSGGTILNYNCVGLNC